ncbi:MAG TPA: c-type cytochrome [Planctomycetota bacterium]|nr:c-type cytochrome [Planctomycetota bacterium]
MSFADLRRFSLMSLLAAACAFGGEPAKPAFKPAAASGLLADVKVQDGYTATLYAAPPEVGYPTGLVCAPNGDLFVAIDQNGSLGHDPNRGFIVRCEDKDGDGKAEKVVQFAKLDSPRGLVHTGDKLFVLNPPTLTVFKINPDGSASEPEILVKKMGGGREHPRGADHTTNQIQIGIDGWIYIAVGDFGFFKAVDKSGKELEYHGGGVARVRQDGTELEIVSWGQRNIYDMAISPLLDIFTRDNTNDGDGWDVHLSHVIMGANYGYPSHYKSFRDEMIPELVDYGGGSPCGSLYLDEPGFPEGVGNALYTCEWGRGPVFRHPLEASGASFKAQQVPFVELTRATDMEVDGQGRLYICSWKNGGFSYAKPDVGYVARVTYNENKTPAFPDLSKASDADLVAFMASNSHFKRIHTQHEMLRRGAKPEFISGLEKLALTDGPINPRVAAIFTLKQLLGAKSHDALIKMAGTPAIKEFALRALADRKSEGKDVPTKLFVDSLSDNNPRVRLQAATGLLRLERRDAADALIPALSDADYYVSHIAFRALVALNAGEECLKALDKSPNNIGVLKPLQIMHDPKVVDGLLERLPKAQDPALKHGILKALCRLHFKEAPWDGSWWGTRPDSSGPYFKHTTWEASEKIGAALKTALNSGDAATVKPLIMELQKHKIDMPEAMSMLLKFAEQDPALRESVVTMMSKRKELTAESAGLLEKIALSESSDAALRTKTFGVLQKFNNEPAQNAAVRVLIGFGAENKPELTRARESYFRDGERAKQVPYFSKLSASDKAAEREIAFSVLLQVAGNKQAKNEQKAAANKVIDAAWAKPAAAELLKAIAHAKANDYAAKVKEKLADTNAEIAAAAGLAAKALKLDGKAASGPAKPTIGTLDVEKVTAEAMKIKGDEKVGADLFVKQRCVACHTITKAEGLKGPFLGDVATRYKRAELLESILSPNAKIAQGFVGYLFKMKDGKRYEGFVSKEAGEEVEIRNAAGEAQMLPLHEIEKRTELKTSIMPSGIVDNLTVEEFASLLAYLESMKVAK